MEARRGRELLLAGCVVVLAAAGYVAYAGGWPLGTSVTEPPASNGQGSQGSQGSQGRRAKNDRSAPAEDEALSVHLKALNAERPKPDAAGRNLFRFKPKPLPPPPLPPPKVRSPAELALAAAPTGPPPPPPITLKFIGIVDAGQSKKLAILSDGRGSPVYGREGETILGQYRILRIGTESIEMAYLDGRGRQTIRLSGS
jgi:hypothetical protein